MTCARKPWWKRKRWRFAAAIWLALPILYLLGMGPAFYAWYSDWISDDVLVVIYTPVAEIQKRSAVVDAAINSYVGWWFELYVRHNPEQFTHPDTGYRDSQPAEHDPASNAN